MYWLYETRDVDAIAERADECTAVAEDEGYVFWVATMHVYRGWARCMRGDTEGGIAEMLAGRDGYIRTESGVFLPQMHMLIAEGYRAGGKPAEALEAIEQGLQIAEEHEERAYVSELHRLRGEIEVEQGKLAEGEASFRKGFEIAGGQKAPFLQLRCALPLSRLLTERGDRDEARGMIESLLGRIEGGRDLRELVEAEAMLASV
jgi:ATP/maltotriose-dependent transcriptional regulator MalT